MARPMSIATKRLVKCYLRIVEGGDFNNTLQNDARWSGS